MRRVRGTCVAMTVLAAACAVTLISPYDESTDRMVTALQGTVDSFLVALAHDPQTPGCTYARNRDFYTRTLTGVSALEVRNRARPQNQLTVEQVVLLDSSVVLLERLHRGKGDTVCMSAAELEPLRRNFNTIFTAILTLELAKKRGK